MQIVFSVYVWYKYCVNQLLAHALGKPENSRVLFVDMNGFFASVEQQDDPALRGKPVGVVSHMHRRATVLASSYEAKACGVTTGIKFEDAKMLCPGIILLEGHHHRYKEVHLQFIKILESICGPEVQPRSIDEAAIYLSPNWRHRAHGLALEIKARFRSELGECIRCSIGIAPNSLLAKLATKLQKPDGLVEITLENTVAVLGKLELTALPGIATRMEAQLARHDITTPLELYGRDPEILRQQLGIWGQYWWWRLHGFECDGLSMSGLKSMSHEHVLHHWLHSKSELEAVVAKMADRVLSRLEKNGLQCTHIYVSCKLNGAPRFTAVRNFDAPTRNVPKLLEAFQELLAEIPAQLPFAVRKVSLGLYGLAEQSGGDQLDLFGALERGNDVGRALQYIRARHGYAAIQVASTLAVKRGVAQERVGFGRLRDVENLSATPS